VSPILVRPVREQLEHDRIIRLLQPRYRRRFLVGINPGAETNAPVGEGTTAIYPDLVLMPTGRSKKLAGVVEVETQESVNMLEAMAQWATFGRLPVEFALYVPAGSSEVAKRLCGENKIGVTEIVTYHAIGDQVRFTQVFRSPVEAKLAAARAAAAAADKLARKRKPAARPSKTPARPARKAVARPAHKPATPKAKPVARGKAAGARKPAPKKR
jgi:hypothetical protein